MGLRLCGSSAGLHRMFLTVVLPGAALWSERIGTLEFSCHAYLFFEFGVGVKTGRPTEQSAPKVGDHQPRGDGSIGTNRSLPLWSLGEGLNKKCLGVYLMPTPRRPSKGRGQSQLSRDSAIAG